MASRGKILVQFALQSKENKTVDDNYTSANEQYGTYCIQDNQVQHLKEYDLSGKNLTNNSLTEEVNHNNKKLPSEYDFFEDACDSDDSLKDPNWQIEKKRQYKTVFSSSSEEESDEEVCDLEKETKTKKGDCIQNNNIHIVNITSNNENLIDHEEVVSTIDENPATNTRKRPKKGMGNPENWEKNVNKKLRMEGKAYKGIKKIDGIKSHCAQRCERIQAEYKCSKRCKTKKKCFEINDSMRKELFQAFWERMTWDEKKTYVSSLVTKHEPSNRIKHGRRKFTYTYSLRLGVEKLPVCKDLFLSTLGIGEYTVYGWLKSRDDHGLPEPSNKNSRTKEDSEDVTLAKTFLSSLPKMPSHYCRSTSSREYLEPIFTTFSDLYHVYENSCTAQNKNIGRKLFQKIFDTMNLALFRPKKDQCDVCVGHETNNVSEEEYILHVERKESAREEKDRDKQRAIQNDNIKVFTMDVQSVLLSPKIEASAMYYKTKLTCHNFTIYNMATKNVKCYFWHEGEGGLTANSFASCLNDHIEEVMTPQTEEIVLISDGCGYQNRNATLSNTLLRLAVKHNVVICQKYLEKGHTQMEVDSVHSTIERYIKRRPIYSPANYVQYFHDVRKGQPYVVKYIDHSFFKDFCSLKYYETIRPGNKVGDPVVTDIRCLRYLPDGAIQFKLSYSSEYNIIQRRRNTKTPSVDDIVPPLYQ